MKILETDLPGDTRQGPGILARRAGEASSQKMAASCNLQLMPPPMPPALSQLETSDSIPVLDTS